MSYQISATDFEKIVKQAIDKIPKTYKDGLVNVGFFAEDEPTKEQAKKLNLRPCDSLFGLFEGVPKTENDGGYAFTLPSKITIFKKAHEQFAQNEAELKKQVFETVWHEVAHYYGLNHDQMHALQNKS
ncbi:metallopeptidase family protein [Candidatus Saccharibacteria bacterium]|jgi:predicted Zn-dependent protease with MMP-like domain|nr:metallopeptidase family protein [Candidatus Saccharibacteria bacterium]